MAARHPRPRQQFDLHEKRYLKQQLHHPRPEHPPGQRHGRIVQVRRQPQGGADHTEIEQHRRKRRSAEAAVAIEYAGRHGH